MIGRGTPVVRVATAAGLVVDVPLHIVRVDGAVTVWGALLVVEHRHDLLDLWYQAMPDNCVIELSIQELPDPTTEGTP